MMHYNEDIAMYSVEIKGIDFIREEPSEKYEKKMLKIADRYWESIDSIVEFILPDVQEVYKGVDADIVKASLGKPTIDFDNGTIDYMEQSLDDEHIFRLEFSDDKFHELEYFTIDG